MPPPPNRGLRVLAAITGAFALLFVIAHFADRPATEVRTESSPTAPAPPRHTPAPKPSCYEVHKFCIGLESLEEEIVDREGRPADESHDGRVWRMVTVTLTVDLGQGESKGTFTSANVALIDTAGGRHTNDNHRVGLGDQGVTFDRMNRQGAMVTYVFILDEEEEVDCVRVSAGRGPEELCLPG